jgi:hypothetical protein
LGFSFAAETPANENGPAAARRKSGCPQGVGFFETPPLTAFRKGDSLSALCFSAVDTTIFCGLRLTSQLAWLNFTPVKFRLD